MTRYSALFVILGSALWATDALFRRPLTGTLSPVTIVMLEHCVLALIMVPIAVRRRREFLLLKARDHASLLFIALGGSVAATILFTYAIKFGNPSVVILLQKTQPLITVLLARLSLGEKPARWFWPCFAGAVVGACWMSAPDWQGARALNPGHPATILCALGAAALWASATVCGRYVVARTSIPFLTAVRFLFALPALILVYLLQPAPLRSLPDALPPSLAIIGMALIPGLFALLLYYKGLKSTPASVASICELTFPVAAVALNWWILQVKLSSAQLTGGAILITSVTIIAWMHARGHDLRPDKSYKHIQS